MNLLPPDQFSEPAFFSDQLLIGAFFRNTAVFQKEDTVTVLHRGKPVRNNDAGAVQFAQRIRNGLLRDIVQSARRLIEQQDRGL